MSPIKLLAVCLPMLAVGTSGFGSAPTALGRQQIKAHGLLHTKALVVARLVKRVQKEDVAYVVFENLRVVRGNEPRMLLVFNHPTPTSHTAPIFNRISARDVALLMEGQTFLITLGKPYLPPLVRWVPLTKDNQKDAIERELKPYRELDRNLKRDPWKAVEDKSLFVQACTLSYFGNLATEKELKSLLADFAQGKRRLRMHYLLAWTALDRAIQKDCSLAPEMLSRIFRLKIDDVNAKGIIGMIRARVVRCLDEEESRDYDQILVDAVIDGWRDVRIAALDVLRRRKVPACLPGIRKALAGIPGDTSPAYEISLAELALRFQLGKPDGVNERLRRLVAAPRDRERKLRKWFYFLRQKVKKRHVATLRAIDDPKINELHVNVTKLLVCAGDEAAQSEYLRLVKNGTIKRLPYHEEPYLIRHAAAFRESAKWMLANRRCEDGAGFMSCAEVLLHLRDPELSGLLVPWVKDDHFHHWALQYLVLIAAEKHRPIFRAHLKHKRPAMRAFAWAGLAALRDKDALLKVAELAALAPDSGTRYDLTETVLPRMKVAAIIKAWENGPPSKRDSVEKAVHAFVLHRLKLVKNVSAKAVRP